ncbi:hypothetical protein [Staphylococcus sp. 17KM0847]|uniref:hypothetical protein n=1 Tax=Staphylococcus sp. 17KM0847 TaxID=2583989 RepID=UPI0015DC4CD9|nr:hypothetical protein [Staphylococcus sp. 17KM0847]QLK86762.1 hypothetical protein FGL66_08690 [Staphylococcus sp. 17KM0847]
MVREFDELSDMLSGLGDEEKNLLEQELMKRGVLPEQPDSIIELMSNYKVEEIKALCREHGIKGYTSMNKDEMLVHFIDTLVTEAYIQQEVDKMTKDQRLAFVLTSYKTHDMMPFVSTVDFSDTFLIFNDDEDEEMPILKIPAEIQETVAHYIASDRELQGLITKYRVLEAATNLYGLYTYTQLQNVFKTYLNETATLMDVERFLKRCLRVAPEIVNYRIVNGAIVSIGLQLEEDEFPQFLEGAHYYMPKTIEDLLFFESNIFSMSDEDMIDFLSWLDRNVIKDNKFNANANQLNVELLTMMKHAISYEMVGDILLSMVNDGILRKRVTVTHENKVKPIYMKMRNWIFHGYTFEEYMEILDKEYKYDGSKIIDINQHKK